MGSINFTGTGTGIDWDTIIEAQVASRAAQIIQPLENWKDDWESKLSAIDGLRDYLSDLQSAVQAMDTRAELASYAVQSSSESTVTAAVTGTPTSGSYSLEINQLAEAELEMHSGVDDADTVVNDSGSTLVFAYTYAGETVTVDVADGTTLSGLADLINNDASNPGVTASVLSDGGTGSTSHHLSLRGDDTGSTYTIAIDAGSTTLAGDWGNLSADATAGSGSVTVDDVSPFAQYQAILVNDDDSSAEYHIIDSISSSTLNLRGTLGSNFTTAQNAYATPRGIGSGVSSSLSSGATEISVADASHFQTGKTIIIADGSNYEQAEITGVDSAAGTITVSTGLTNAYASDAYVTQLEGGRKFTFEDTDFSQVQAAQNAQVRLDGYPAGSWIERESNVVSDLITGVTLTLHSTTGGTPATITVNPDSEEVKTKIESFVEAYNDLKVWLNERTSYNATTEEAGVLLGNYAADITEMMLRETIVGRPPGFQDGSDPYTLLDEVGLETRGRTDDESMLGTIEITESELDDALSEDFDGVIRLFADSFSGFSDSDELRFYQASETLTTPGIYDVEADFDASGNLTGGRFKLSSESTFRSATVDGSYLVGTADNPEEALWVRAEWDGSSSTQTATIRVTQGVAGRLADQLEDLLDTSDGLLANVDESYRGIIGDIDDRIAEEEERLERMRQRLTEKYARLEQMLVQMQAQQDWASQLSSSMTES